MTRIETVPPTIKAHRSILYEGELKKDTPYNIIIIQANGAFHTIPVKFIKSSKAYPLETVRVSIIADIEFEYDDATSV